MYTKVIFAAQIIFISLISEARLVQTRLEWNDGTTSAHLESTEPAVKGARLQYGIVDEQKLRNYVAQSVSQIKKIAKAPQYSAGQKLEYIKKTAEAVATYRSKNWTRSAFTEHDMDLLIKPYESFPERERFAAKKCSQYMNRIAVEWDPLASDQGPSEKGVSDALAVLQTICQSSS